METTRTMWEARESEENFPVALRVLPRRHREHLHAVYGFARHVDELGDSYQGDRTAALTEFRGQTLDLWRGVAPMHPVLRRLAPTVRECGLSLEPFDRLIQANLADQQVSRYATSADLREYCRLSADPVGRIVLEVFGCATPGRIALSDQVCTGLQIIEHLQDVGEDYRAGRIYLPTELMAAYGVPERDLGEAAASGELRALVLAETERTVALLRAGSALVGELRGWARLAVAGFVAGGLAAADAVRRTGGDVLAQQAAPATADVLRHAAQVWRKGHR
ncbi:MAG: squalene synthase HpnC [Nocardioides sp.]|uniref:squalene synthase HpnC n=1 Tax=Nocardioides sp. TaxID=35761 RepID=UPI0039E2C9B4